eukprot:scaffold673422_cov88-Prasinocladus_malaysianus.AAC.1
MAHLDLGRKGVSDVVCESGQAPGVRPQQAHQARVALDQPRGLIQSSQHTTPTRVRHGLSARSNYSEKRSRSYIACDVQLSQCQDKSPLPQISDVALSLCKH